MLDRLTGFVDALRAGGIPVSTSEAADASLALKEIEWDSRSRFRTALFSSTVKSPAHRDAFNILFDVYFPESPGDHELRLHEESEDLIADLADALSEGDLVRLEALLREAVDRFAGMIPGRPVGGRYYQWKVEQALGLDALRGAIAEALADGSLTEGSPLALLLGREEAAGLIAELRRRLERIIRTRLVAERGPEAMARALARPLPEEIDFLQATGEDLAEMRRTVAALARRLAARLSYRHHHGGRGRLDFRRTIRASLQTGGVPVSPRFRRRTQRAELVVLCDLSGSVAAFSRFALMLLYALSQHFRKIRSFAFVDAIDEVTHFFEGSDLDGAAKRLRAEANVVWLDGHSDYGRCFARFVTDYPDALTPHATVLVLGDARSNFRAPEEWTIHQIANRTRRAYLLNPEPRRHWNTGDSIVGKYESAFDAVIEVRNLRQLAAFVERIG